MRWERFRGSLRVLVALLGAGCNEDDGFAASGTGSSGGEVTPAHFAGECEAIVGCGCEYVTFVDEVGFADAEACAKIFSAEWARIEASAKAAGLTADLGCYESTRPFAAYGCKNPFELSEAMVACSHCQHGYGSKGIGEPCKAYGERLSECAQGLRCPPGTDARCEDPCATVAMGQSCEVKSCAEGLECTNDQVCLAPGGVGEPCISAEQPCEEGLFCSELPEPQCSKLGELGEPCDLRPCAVGLTCDYSQSMVCVEVPGEGEPCVEYQCAEGLLCDDTQMPAVCVARPGEGELCMLGACAEGLFCDMAQMTAVCVALPGEGEPCVESQCAEGLLCDDTQVPAVCSAIPGEGEPCVQNWCPEGHFCNSSNVCERDPPRICSEVL